MKMMVLLKILRRKLYKKNIWLLKSSWRSYKSSELMILHWVVGLMILVGNQTILLWTDPLIFCSNFLKMKRQSKLVGELLTFNWKVVRAVKYQNYKKKLSLLIFDSLYNNHLTINEKMMIENQYGIINESFSELEFIEFIFVFPCPNWMIN